MWYNKGEEFADVYIGFLSNLLTTRMDLLSSVLSQLTQHLWVTSPRGVTVAEGEGGGEEEGRGVMERIHKAIKTVVNLFPSATSTLMPLVKKGYPFMGRGPEIQVNPLSLSSSDQFFSLFIGNSIEECFIYDHVLPFTER